MLIVVAFPEYLRLYCEEIRKFFIPISREELPLFSGI